MNPNTSPVESPDTGDGGDSFLPLLVALIATLVLAPLAKPLPLLASLIGAVALLSGLIAVRHDRSFRAAVIGGLAVCLPLRLAAQGSPQEINHR